ASWQKGSVENANRLIRKYIPKKADFDEFSHKRIMNIQKKLNGRPREKLKFHTQKNEFFNKIL
ncbi:IS30 family transposase, partial [Prevotella sp. OH937_COT-195]